MLDPSFRGLFLSLDGLDGTGKSTQCRLLMEWLHALKLPAVHCIDPGGTPLGSELRKILLDRRDDISMRAEALLFMASRAELVERIISPALRMGEIVVSDRYLLSTVVFQGHAGMLPVDELWQVGTIAASGIEPHLTFVLDLPVDEAKKRRGRTGDRVESRPPEYHEKVRQGFRKEVERRPELFRLIDASADVDAIQQQIRTAVEPLLQYRGHIVRSPAP